jgi:lipopolysaccharide exporter
LSYWSFVIGDTAFWIVLTALTYQKAQHHFKLRLDKEIRREVVTYSLGATGTSLGFYLNSNGDNFIIGKILGSLALGYYNFAYQLTLALNTILNQAMNQVGMTAYAEIKDRQRLKQVMLQVTEHTAFIAAPLYSLSFLLLSPQFITTVFGAKWLPSCAVIPWLLILAYCRLLNGSVFSMLSAIGRPDISAKVNLHIAPFALLGFWVGAQWNGILGVSIAAALSLGVTWTIYCYWLSCRILNWPLLDFLKPCFISATFSTAAIFIALQVPNYFNTLLFILVYVLLMRCLAKKQFFEYQSYLETLFKYSIKRINFR